MYAKLAGHKLPESPLSLLLLFCVMEKGVFPLHLDPALSSRKHRGKVEVDWPHVFEKYCWGYLVPRAKLRSQPCQDGNT